MEVAQGWSPSVTAINAVTGTTTGNYPSATGVDTGAATAVAVHVASASTSVATVLIQGSIDGTFWYTLATIANPTAVGEYWAGPAPRKLRIRISAHTSDAISAFYCFRQMQADPIGHEWKVITQAANSFGALSVTSLTDSGLTATRVPFAGSGGLLADDATLLFAAAKLTVPNLVDSGLTITRVPYASTSGLLIDAAAFNYATASGQLAATSFKGLVQTTPTTKLTDGAIAKTAGNVFITKGSVLGSSTLAQPTITTDDGLEITITSTTAYAHVITCASGGINGGTTTTVTFTSGAIGDSVTLRAYQAVWYIVASRGTITLS